MSRVVLDASALLAFINGEPGGEIVPVTTGDALISAVNFAEVISVMTTQGMDETAVRKQLAQVVLEVLEFERGSAEEAGFMISKTKGQGLSLGDRACLSAARRESIPAMTSDRSWANVHVGVEVKLIR
jgi:PIN domain nuclease of toxin-antitoxin system